MDVKTISDGHDGSLCLLRNGKVERHFAAERVNHVKHSKVCEKSIEYFGEDLTNVAVSKIESSHHIFHAAHSFYDSGFPQAICVIVDGMGSHVQLNTPHFAKGTYGRESISVYYFEYPNKFVEVYREVVVPFDCNLYYKDLNMKVTSNISPGLMFQKTCESRRGEEGEDSRPDDPTGIGERVEGQKERENPRKKEQVWIGTYQVTDKDHAVLKSSIPARPPAHFACYEAFAEQFQDLAKGGDGKGDRGRLKATTRNERNPPAPAESQVGGHGREPCSRVGCSAGAAPHRSAGAAPQARRVSSRKEWKEDVKNAVERAGKVLEEGVLCAEDKSPKETWRAQAGMYPALALGAAIVAGWTWLSTSPRPLRCMRLGASGQTTCHRVSGT